MRKKGYRFFKNDEKIAKNHDFWEQNKPAEGKKSCFFSNKFQNDG
jgi:hypothetical protein